MATDRPNQTLADYVAIAFSPALIMGLVGSLVFFLLEVLYPVAGEYKGRLQWILFFFVFGAVLVGRISITQGVAGRAGLYGLDPRRTHLRRNANLCRLPQGGRARPPSRRSSTSSWSASSGGAPTADARLHRRA